MTWACLQTRLRAAFTVFSPLASLLLLDVPPVRLRKSALPGTKIRQNLRPSEFEDSPSGDRNFGYSRVEEFL